MSVNWTALSTVEETLRGGEAYGIVSITADLCWKQNQDIEHTPVPNNHAHCDVIGRKTRAVKRAFKEGAVWLRMPKQTG